MLFDRPHAVAVQRNQDVTLGVIQPGRQRRLVAEVAAQMFDVDPRFVRRQGLQNPLRLTGGIVVDVGNGWGSACSTASRGDGRREAPPVH